MNDNAYWLLTVNAEFILSRLPSGGTAVALFLAGSGGTANPPTLSLASQAPTGATAKYKDSPAVNFSGGNPWAEVGTWNAAAALVNGTLTALGEGRVWLGLKNSDDIGTNFDLRVEVHRNETLLAAGEIRCIQGITRNPAYAKEIGVPFGPVTAAAFNGTTDVLSLRVVTRIGTTETGARCGGHSNAVGLRLYFDAVSRAAQVTATF